MFKEFEEFLKKNNIWHEFLEKENTSTAERASKYVGNVVKSIIFDLGNDEFILVIVPGSMKVSRKKLRPLIKKENIKLASAEDVLRVTGFEIGAVPPIGHRSKVRCILDKQIAAMSDIWAGGGAINRLVHLKVKDIIKYANAIIADVSE